MPSPRKVEAIIDEIQNYGNGVYSVVFIVPKSFTRFNPGQFAHLTVDYYNPSDGYWPESRVFSLASRPKTENIRLVYSVKGRYTKKIRDRLKKGSKCWLKLPYGDFTIERDLPSDRPIVLIAGGTGIAPYISYLLDGSKTSPERKVLIYYGMRNPSLLIFEQELDKASAEMPGLSLTFFSEERTEDRRFRFGKLNIDEIYKESCQLERRPVFFLSGPPSMINSFKSSLIGTGTPDADIRLDEWE